MKAMSFRKSQFLQLIAVSATALFVAACQSGSDDSTQIKNRGKQKTPVTTAPNAKALPAEKGLGKSEGSQPVVHEQPKAEGTEGIEAEDMSKTMVGPANAGMTIITSTGAVSSMVNTAPLDNCGGIAHEKGTVGCPVNQIHTVTPVSPETVETGLVPSAPMEKKDESSVQKLPQQEVTLDVIEDPKQAIVPDASMAPEEAVIDSKNTFSHQMTFKKRYLRERTNKVDLLFVVDTKAELKGIRQKVAKGFKTFTDGLGPHISLHVGVLPAHSKSDNSHHGVLFNFEKRSSGDTHPKILRTGSADEDELSQEELISELERHMELVPEDPDQLSTQGGQYGISSLYSLLSEESVKRNQTNGFFRPYAALVVIFVSNQADACYVPTNVDIAQFQLTEEEAKRNFIATNSTSCKGISPEVTLQRLLELKKDMPLIVSGILHTANQNLTGKNTVGLGYRSMIINKQTRMDHQWIKSIAQQSETRGADSGEAFKGGYPELFNQLQTEIQNEMSGEEFIFLSHPSLRKENTGDIRIQVGDEFIGEDRFHLRTPSKVSPELWIKIPAGHGENPTGDITIHYNLDPEYY